MSSYTTYTTEIMHSPKNHCRSCGVWAEDHMVLRNGRNGGTRRCLGMVKFGTNGVVMTTFGLRLGGSHQSVNLVTNSFERHRMHISEHGQLVTNSKAGYLPVPASRQPRMNSFHIEPSAGPQREFEGHPREHIGADFGFHLPESSPPSRMAAFEMSSRNLVMERWICFVDGFPTHSLLEGLFSNAHRISRHCPTPTALRICVTSGVP